jgi:hypothetical protein
MSGQHTEGVPCWECENEILRNVSKDFRAVTRQGEVVVNSVPMLKCYACGSLVIGSEGNQIIEAVLAKAANREVGNG